MGDHHNPLEEIKRFRNVFIALIVGTILTVGVAYIHFQSIAVTIGIGLAIATVKASLVAGYFMHLLSEKALIYWVMGFTFFFFASMMGLIIWGMQDIPHIEAATW